MIQRVVPPSAPRTAYVLGAGFSRAASGVMPITDQLGRQAVARLGGLKGENVPIFRADGITFESWLTWLAERQPFLDEAEHLHDQTRFAELTSAIAVELQLSQASAGDTGYADWLAVFLDLLHWSRSDVITLNYDTIVEGAMDDGIRYDNDSVVHSSDIVTGFPNGRGLMFGSGPYFEDRETFRLHKLHGSIDWFSVPGDRTGATMKRIPHQRNETDSVRRATVGGRDVFIVPPTSTKGSYFDNPITRVVWREARDGLREAERVVLIGYSLPLTDTALARLLATTIASGTQNVLIVNPDADAVATRLQALGVDDDRISTIDGPDCVEVYVTAEVERASKELVDMLAIEAEVAPGRPVAIGWEEQSWGAITGFDLSEEDATLQVLVDRFASPLAGIQHPSTQTDDPYERHTVTVGELFHRGIPSRIIVQYGDEEWPVCARVLPAPATDEDWLLLRAAGVLGRSRSDGT